MVLLVTSFVKNNMAAVENILATNQVEGNELLTGLMKTYEQALQYMVQFSYIPEESLFKICVEFWHYFTYEVMITQRQDFF